MHNAHIPIDNRPGSGYNIGRKPGNHTRPDKARKEKQSMTRSEEEKKAAQQKAVRDYEKRNYRLNIVFPGGTKERIDALNLDKTNSAFIRDTVLSKLDELERILR